MHADVGHTQSREHVFSVGDRARGAVHDGLQRVVTRVIERHWCDTGALAVPIDKSLFFFNLLLEKKNLFYWKKWSGKRRDVPLIEACAGHVTDWL